MFNLIVTGYGGQGVLSLASVIAKAALKQGYDVKQAELHGLAQRGGSLQCYVRFGNKVYSPLVTKADLIISLESFEALRSCNYADKKTKIVTNSKVFRFNGNVLDKIKKCSKKVYVVDADDEVRKLTGDILGVNFYVLGYAISNGLLPLDKDVVFNVIKEKVHKRFLGMNKLVFEKGCE